MPAARAGSTIYLVLLFAFCVWRAATQSFSTDEAYSYDLYVGAEPFNIFRQYDANLHLLHTWLCWLSVRLLGLSELTFRLPSLLGAALYFTGVYRLCSRMTQSSAILILGVVSLTINPLILDHMVVARGYGLALGFFVWALAEAAPGARPRVAVLLALSVAANLTFLFPAAALVFALASGGDWRGVARSVAAPAAILIFLAWVLPLSLLVPGQFYFGSSSLTQMNQTLADVSLGWRLPDVLLNSLAFGWCTWAALVWWRKRDGSLPALAAGTFATTVGVVLMSHFVAGLPLPYARTGIYFLLLAPLCLFALGRWSWAALAILVLAAAPGIRADRFQEWISDAYSRETIQAIAARPRSGPVRVAASTPTEWPLNLYRKMLGLDWMRVERFDSATRADYYVLWGGDLRFEAEIGLKRIYTSPTGTVLAARVP